MRFENYHIALAVALGIAIGIGGYKLLGKKGDPTDDAGQKGSRRKMSTFLPELKRMSAVVDSAYNDYVIKGIASKKGDLNVAWANLHAYINNDDM